MFPCLGSANARLCAANTGPSCRCQRYHPAAATSAADDNDDVLSTSGSAVELESSASDLQRRPDVPDAANPAAASPDDDDHHDVSAELAVAGTCSAVESPFRHQRAVPASQGHAGATAAAPAGAYANRAAANAADSTKPDGSDSGERSATGHAPDFDAHFVTAAAAAAGDEADPAAAAAAATPAADHHATQSCKSTFMSRRPRKGRSR